MAEKLSVLISKEDIQKRIEELGVSISRDYAGKDLRMICVLKGGVYFMTALSNAISEDVKVSIDFMQTSSYGNGTNTTGVVKILKDLDESIEGKNVLIVEDILDSGLTLSYLRRVLVDRNPASLKICTLLDKPGRRQSGIQADYTGFKIEDKFVVGCGMDYAQHYRNLPYIAVVELEDDK